MKQTIFVGIPVLESIKAHTFDSILKLFDFWRANPHFNLKYSTIIGSRQIHFARNALVRAGLSGGADYICFIDADMTFPPDTLHKLYYASKDICGVLYCGRIEPHPPNIFFWNKDKTDLVQVKKVRTDVKLLEVDGVGTGFMLIRDRVFSEMKQPYFFYENNRSEDIMFCREARRKNFKIYVDTTCKVGHVGDTVHYYANKKRTKD